MAKKPAKLLTFNQRYRRFVKAIVAERGARCESCGVKARHVHHLLPIAKTGVTDELAFEPGNVIVVCSECHKLFHPGCRKYPWEMLKAHRTKALAARR